MRFSNCDVKPFQATGFFGAAKLTGGVPAFAGITGVAFSKPMAAKTWLQASNPSERWKWDHMFQDLAPVKGTPLLVRGDLKHEE